jgi:hypothetical protein
MTFREALVQLKLGSKIARDSWGSKIMFLFYVPGSEEAISKGRPLASAFPVGTECRMLPSIMMGIAVPGLPCVPWLPSQADDLAEDWVIVPN